MKVEVQYHCEQRDLPVFCCQGPDNLLVWNKIDYSL